MRAVADGRVAHLVERAAGAEEAGQHERGEGEDGGVGGVGDVQRGVRHVVAADDGEEGGEEEDGEECDEEEGEGD